ncbi:hypothetical protein P154DRAFT_617154 [Amniculicola lignicola CBS 123094]|uniref:Phosphotransferase n=1 Tax=Amniculicola lignicola CBS 123094 TaxID=1392246 RepID=A0A6A5WU50_9PLEO|nr:hypothetical protein P154DRAFT_617154 [Amniculicola lignicola CBS 123094]
MKKKEEDRCTEKLSGQSSPEAESQKQEGIRDVAERIAAEFEFSDKDIGRAVAGFVRQMNDGLIGQGRTIEQLPSFVTELPTGLEKGTYLAVDLGGTNIRVCSVTLNGDRTYSLRQDKVPILTTLMTSNTSNGLFNFIAHNVEDFLRNNYPKSLMDNTERPSEGKDSKGFDIDGVVGQDICALLQTALNELTLPVHVTALVNDTVGTLMAQAYVSPKSSNTVLGAVFGTGTNGAYVEEASKVTKLNSDQKEKEGIIVINSEWGNFDQSLEYLPTTIYDKVIDTTSVNPGFEIFEKCISGMYLGEILRLVISSLINNPNVNLFAGLLIPVSSKLYVQWGLDSSLLANLESDTTRDLSYSIKQIQHWTGITSVSFEDAQALRTISHAIGRRSARLSAVALGAVILQTSSLEGNLEGKRVDIGVDGSLIELYPGFVAELIGALRAIEKIGVMERMVDIVVAKDGSGVGAALAAHVAAKQIAPPKVHS